MNKLLQCVYVFIYLFIYAWWNFKNIFLWSYAISKKLMTDTKANIHCLWQMLENFKINTEHPPHHPLFPHTHTLRRPAPARHLISTPTLVIHAADELNRHTCMKGMKRCLVFFFSFCSKLYTSPWPSTGNVMDSSNV